MICDYGCGQEAKHQFKNGKWCCGESYVSCPEVRQKNRVSSIGKYHSEKTINKMRESKRGSKNSTKRLDVREKISKNMQGKVQSEETKEKRSRSLKLKDHNAITESSEKRKLTNLQRYRVEFPYQLQEFRKKGEETCLRNYNVTHPSKSEQVKEKKKETSLKNNGVDHPTKSEDARQRTRQRVTGNGNPNWNLNREEVFAPYTEQFHCLDYREQIKKEQCYKDPVTDQILSKSAHLHHIDYNKQNDKRENLIWLNLSTHMKTNGSKKNREKWQTTLQETNNKIIDSCKDLSGR